MSNYDFLNRSPSDLVALNKEFRTEYVATLDAVKEVFTSRAAEYDRLSYPLDHFPFGPSGFVQVIWMKFMRLRSGLKGLDFDQGKLGAKKTVRDSILDLINYLIFLYIWLQKLEKSDA